MGNTISIEKIDGLKTKILYNNIRQTIDHLQSFLVNETPAHVSKEKVPDSQTAYRLCKSMELLEKEEFRILIMDTLNQLIRIETISVGTVNSSLVSPREVFRTALLYDAVTIIGVHNHPSGSTDPSQQDIKITRDLCKAGKLINIKVLDHIIIGNQRYSSLADLGIITREQKGSSEVIKV